MKNNDIEGVLKRVNETSDGNLFIRISVDGVLFCIKGVSRYRLVEFEKLIDKKVRVFNIMPLKKEGLENYYVGTKYTMIYGFE